MGAQADQDAIAGVIVHTRLENGQPICIRAIRASDEERMRRGIAMLSKQSRYLRFFSPAPAPPDAIIAKLVAVDGHRHLGWGAILSDQPELPAIGAVHAVREDPSSPRAEFAIGVIDRYHGQGLARMLIAVLLIQCRSEGIVTIEAQVLFENKPAAALVLSLGAQRTATEAGVSDYIIDVTAALDRLKSARSPAGLRDVFAAFARYL